MRFEQNPKSEISLYECKRERDDFQGGSEIYFYDICHFHSGAPRVRETNLYFFVQKLRGSVKSDTDTEKTAVINAFDERCSWDDK